MHPLEVKCLRLFDFIGDNPNKNELVAGELRHFFNEAVMLSNSEPNLPAQLEELVDAVLENQNKKIYIYNKSTFLLGTMRSLLELGKARWEDDDEIEVMRTNKKIIIRWIDRKPDFIKTNIYKGCFSFEITDI